MTPAIRDELVGIANRAISAAVEALAKARLTHSATFYVVLSETIRLLADGAMPDAQVIALVEEWTAEEKQRIRERESSQLTEKL